VSRGVRGGSGITKADSFGAKEVDADVAVKVLLPPAGVRWMCSVGKKKLHATAYCHHIIIIIAKPTEGNHTLSTKNYTEISRPQACYLRHTSNAACSRLHA